MVLEASNEINVFDGIESFEDFQSSLQSDISELERIEDQRDTLDVAANCVPLVIGRKIYLAEVRFGQAKIDNFIGPDLSQKYTPDTIRNWAWIGQRFPENTWKAGVVISVYQALAGIDDPNKRWSLLAEAAVGRWTVSQARKAAGLPSATKEKLPTVTLDEVEFVQFLDAVNVIYPKAAKGDNKEIIEGFINRHHPKAGGK